jgi:hypothetical protein
MMPLFPFLLFSLFQYYLIKHTMCIGHAESMAAVLLASGMSLIWLFEVSVCVYSCTRLYIFLYIFVHTRTLPETFLKHP